jgi:hypothetical protein
MAVPPRRSGFTIGQIGGIMGAQPPLPPRSGGRHGEPPTTLPIERPSRFQLVVNLKTGAQLGVTMPTSILLRAVEVIE